MSRIRIDLPSTFSFSAEIPIRITDLNYGNHVGNDTVLSLIHEARVQFLKSIGYSELEMEGVSLIMSDVGIQFKAELFYGDVVRVQVASQNITRAGFDLYYHLTRNGTTVAIAKTGMVCFDYTKRSIASVPEKAREKLSA
jgi:Predicted thioesterase